MSNNRSFSSRLFVNSIWNASAYIFSTFIGIISAPLYINILGIKQYGLFILLTSILLPFGLLNFGFAEATIKYVSESIAKGLYDEANEYVRSTLLFNILVGLFGSITIIVSARFLSTRIFKIEASDQLLAEKILYWIAATWFVNQVSATFSGIPVAFQRYSIVSIGNSLYVSLNVIIGLIILWMNGNILSLVEFRLIWSLIMLILWFLIARKLLRNIKFWPKWSRDSFKKSFKFGFWQTMADIGSIVANQSDKYVLGAYLSTSVVGLYNIASTVQQSIYILVFKVSDVLFPAFSALQGSKQNDRAVRLMLRSSWLLSALTVIIMGPIIVISYDVLRIYVGVSIAEVAHYTLRLFIYGAFLSSASIAVNQYLLGTGNVKWTSIMTISSGIIVVVSDLFLIPRIGLIATGISDIMMLLPRPIIQYFFWRKFLFDDVSCGEMYGYLYSPVITGAIATTILSWVYTEIRFTPNLFVCLIIAVITSIFLGFIIIYIDRFVPGGRQRGNDIIFLIYNVRLRIIRLISRLGV